MSSSASPQPHYENQQHGDQQNNSLRKLMPASDNGGLSSASTAVVITRKKRRQATPAACGACRKRKSKCDGGRPQCSICRDRKTICEFDTHETETHTQALKRKFSELQSSKSAFEQVFSLLQTRPRKEAEEILDRIRRGADAASVLRHVENGDVLLQLSLVPEARFRYEFPYKSTMPEYLQYHDNPYLDSEVYECVLRSTPKSQQRQALPGIADILEFSDLGDERDPYYKPYSSASVVHPLLEAVKPSKWTLISSDDVLMKKLIHDYFLFEYDWFSVLHIDYFLQDMASECPRFCSPLLVNAILCLGCLSHRGLSGQSEYWNPKNLGNRFLAEARRLFDLEIDAEPPSRSPEDGQWEHKRIDWECQRLTTIQAAVILNITYILNGHDKVGWRLTLQALEMADELDLFRGTSPSLNWDLRCVRELTAWGLFKWQSLVSYHYLKPPVLREPPAAALPDPAAYPNYYGEMWVKYPLTSSRLPIYHGLLFKAKAEFWTILNEFSLQSFPLSRPSNMQPRQIIIFYQRLRRWLSNLPEELTPRKIVFPSQLKLHMHYSHVITDLLKPTLGQNWSDGESPPKSLDETHAEVMLNLETLVRLYYLRHGFESADSFLVHFLGNLGFISRAAIEQESDASSLESHRSTEILLVKGMNELGRAYYVAKAVMRLQASFMSPEEVELVKRFVDVEAEKIVYGPLEQALYSDWPVYEIGYEARVEQKRQGRSFGTLANMISSPREASISPVSSRPSPT
ncbi:hypothetical protein QBC38DRAFT_203026 [Podospora fimiseda]|uniref:Zn(2)-C6 fungal-type domain-containing protein n=1 Tax=Podospora fimiseda TaxID=252190 RepID=A0AAN7BY07_9PEZI|nr:hypothetical protein QBC38DRAFT_203026 [Podospora fimiseda]